MQWATNAAKPTPAVVNFSQGIPVNVKGADGVTRDINDPNLSAGDKALVDAAKKGHSQYLDEQASRDASSLTRSMALINARDQNKVNKPDLATREKVLTYYDQAQGADTRLTLMENSLPKALKGDQQAMLNIVSNHINMVMGIPRGKVGRVPLQLFKEAQQSSPLLQRIGAKFDDRGLLSGATLTPDQMRQMVELGKETFAAEKVAADSKADYIGIPPNDRPKLVHASDTQASGPQLSPQAQALLKKHGIGQ
jgi:hypothetical protein